MKRNITVEHFDHVYLELVGSAYYGNDWDSLFYFRVPIDKIECWLVGKGLVGSVSVDALNDDGDHTTYESVVTMGDYMDEYFDDSVLSEYLSEHNIQTVIPSE